MRPFLLENSGEDRPQIFIPSSKIRHEQCPLRTFDIISASQCSFIFKESSLLRNSFQYKTAIKLGRSLLEKEGCSLARCSSKEMVFGLRAPSHEEVVVVLVAVHLILKRGRISLRRISFK